MNDAAYNQICNRLNILIDRIQLELGLNAFRLKVRFARDEAPEGKRGGSVLMEVSSSWEYCDIAMTVYANACADLDDDYLEMIIWHEFMHVMVAPLTNVKGHEDHVVLDHTEYLEERVCTDLAKAFRWTASQRRAEVERDMAAMQKAFNKEMKKAYKRIAELEAAAAPDKEVAV